MKELIDFNYLDCGKDALNQVRHSHGKSYEIIYVKSGSGVFLINDRVLPLKAGALYLINGITTHCSVPDDPESYHRRKVIVDADFGDRSLSAVHEESLTKTLFSEGGNFYLPTDEMALEIDSAFLGIKSMLQENKDFGHSHLLSCIMRIFLSAYECGESEELFGDVEMIKLLSYLGSNYRNRLTLDEISDAVHMSRYYLCHRFKERFGLTVFEYILQKRLSFAKNQLIISTTAISQISDEAGFSDFSYFSKIFRQFEGISPSEFRKQNRSKYTNS